MKNYYSIKQPYVPKILATLSVEKINETDLGLFFDYRLVYTIARATGLRSKKRRHIEKRFRAVMKQAITGMIKEHKSF